MRKSKSMFKLVILAIIVVLGFVLYSQVGQSFNNVYVEGK